MRIQIIDWILYLITLLLVATGLSVIYSITYAQEATKNFVFHQSLFAFFGILFMLLLTILDYRVLKIASYYLFGFFLILLLLIFTPLGKTIYGATRWINLGFFQFQPSEFFKLILIIFVATILDLKNFSKKHFFLLLFLIFLPIILTILQPDFGSALVLFVVSLVMIFSSGLPKRYLLWLGAFTSILIIMFSLSLTEMRPFTHLLKDYQKERILTFFNPKRDPFGSGYNVSQSTIAIGSGGLFGRGLGYGPQSQLNFVPSKESDFIFSVAAEAFGFLGAGILITLFLLLFLRILRIAQKAKDNFGTLLAYGILTYFIFETLVNIGMNMGIMPVTGIPLPLISYGGSSLFTSLGAIGICQSIMLRHKKITF